MGKVVTDDEPTSGDYEVGYGRPPLRGRFKPGQSGNPRGRPKKTRSVPELIADALDRKIWITVEGRRKRVSVESGIILQISHRALKGDLKAAQLLLRLKHAAEDDDGRGTRHPLLEEDMAILGAAGIKLPAAEPSNDDA